MTIVEKRMRNASSRHATTASSSLGRLSLLLVGSLALPACSLGQLEDDVGTDQSEIISGNGRSLNGVSLNGRSLNGRSLNGRSLNGVSLNGVSLNGSELGAITADGQPVSGTGLVGATMAGQLSDGGTLPLRIDSAASLAAPSSDVWAYGVSFLADEIWNPLCGVDQDGVPILAIPLSGTWDYGSGVTGGGSWSASSSSITFGCRGTALAKCVEFGYRPWSTTAGTLLRDHHQACTRMLRADYCGDGMSWTANGTPINLYDNLGIQADEASWLVDAEWTASGAVCTNHIRDFQSGSPSCTADLDDPDCGSFAGGALLIDEYGE